MKDASSPKSQKQSPAQPVLTPQQQVSNSWKIQKAAQAQVKSSHFLKSQKPVLVQPMFSPQREVGLVILLIFRNLLLCSQCLHLKRRLSSYSLIKPWQLATSVELTLIEELLY